MTHITKLSIQDERSKTGYHLLSVSIDPQGALVFEGVDAGPDVERMLGDFDFEYWLRIKPEFKDAILLHLIRDCFYDPRRGPSKSVHEFEKWLKERNISSEFTSYT